MCGLGTFKSKGEDCTAACVAALQAGYRLIDTARVYRNEAAVGAALRLAQEGQGLPREEVFLTTKIPPTEQGEEAAYAAVLSSLQQLDVKYIDLVLLHWPGKAKTPLNSPLNQQARRGSWAALIRARREGLVRDIGVSNFTQAHLEDGGFQSPQVRANCRRRARLLSADPVPPHLTSPSLSPPPPSPQVRCRPRQLLLACREPGGVPPAVPATGPEGFLRTATYRAAGI